MYIGESIEGAWSELGGNVHTVRADGALKDVLTVPGETPSFLASNVTFGDEGKRWLRTEK